MVKMTLKIDGMMCGMCESHINDTVRKHFPVQKVSSSRSRGETKIIAKEALDEEALRRAIGETGYTVLSVASAPYWKKGFSLFPKNK